MLHVSVPSGEVSCTGSAFTPFETPGRKVEEKEREGEREMRKGNALASLNEELRDFFLETFSETMKGEASLGARRKPPTVSARDAVTAACDLAHLTLG